MFKPIRNLLQISVFQIFIVLNLFFAVLFRFADVPTRDSLAILLVANIQIYVGGIIWARLSSRESLDLVEFVGMGGALGFGLSLISSQLFRTLTPFSISWLILPIFLLILKHFKGGISSGIWRIQLQNSTDMLLICSGTLLALSISWYWLVSTAVAVFFWVVLRFLRESNRAVGVSHSKFQAVLLVAAVVMSVRSLQHLSSLTEIRNPLWWNLRHGVMQDPDLIFFESMMQSARNLGGGENIFFIDLKFYYHWFAFAWEATLGSFSELTPFVVTAIAGPAIAVFIVLSLVFTIARRISRSTFSAPCAMFSVAMLCAGPIPLIGILMPYSFSFNFGLIFLYGLVTVILTNHEMKRSTLGMVVFVLSLCLLGSKVSFGPMLVIGFGFCLVWALTIKRYRGPSIAMSVSGAVAVLFSFMAIYKIGAESGSNFSVSFFEILRHKANLGSGLPGAVVFVSLISVVVHLLAPASGLFFLKNVFDSGKQLGVIFSVAGGLIGIVLGFVLSGQSESEVYFILGGMALLVPVSVATIFADQSRLDYRSRFCSFLGIAACLVAARQYPKIYEYFTVDSGSNYYKLAFATVFPMLVALVSLVLIRIFDRQVIAINTLRMLTILLLVSTVGSYFGHVSKFVEKGVWASRNVSFEPSEVISGSDSYRELLIWLRRNSKENDVVATNRSCSTSTDLPPNCLALWSLTSAISGRQMLIEGNWTTNIVAEMKDESKKRRNLIKYFVNAPTDEGRLSLLDYGVRWVVADFAVTETRSWGKFAEVRFTNDAGSILELVS